jgi:homoserine O-acetyltransferase
VPADPTSYFLILPRQFGGDLSSSPSNTPRRTTGASSAVAIALRDRAAPAGQQAFRIEKLRAVLGWSMGAQQTYEWAVRFPEMVPRAAAFAGTARTPVHNQIFIDLHTELMASDPAFRGGSYHDSAEIHDGLRRHAMA